MRIFLFSDGRLERNRLLRYLQNLAHLGHGNVHALGDLFAGRLAPQFLHQLAAGAHQLVDRLDHVHRDADGARLVGNRASDGLANPPGRVRGKLVAAAPLELIHGLHQADVAFLNEVEELQSAVGIFLRDGNDQAQVRFDQFFLRLLGFRFAAVNQRERALQFGEANFAGVFNVLQFRAARAQLFARFRGDFAFGDVRAALQPAGFAFERLQPLDRAAHLVHQALFLKRIEINVADGEGNLDARARHSPFRANVGTLFALRGLVQLRRLLQRRVVQLRYLVDVLQRLLRLVGDFFFGELFVIKLDNFLDRPHALAQIIANGNQFLI